MGGVWSGLWGPWGACGEARGGRVERHRLVGLVRGESVDEGERDPRADSYEPVRLGLLLRSLLLPRTQPHVVCVVMCQT
eukprot:932598-Rhodomonas_salina.1